MKPAWTSESKCSTFCQRRLLLLLCSPASESQNDPRTTPALTLVSMATANLGSPALARPSWGSPSAWSSAPAGVPTPRSAPCRPARGSPCGKKRQRRRQARERSLLERTARSYFSPRWRWTRRPRGARGLPGTDTPWLLFTLSEQRHKSTLANDS